MNREKQIEEMAKVIEITEQIARDAHCGYPSPRMMATDLYDKGYRKQSEGKWIAKEKMIRSPHARNYYCSECKYEPIEVKSYCPNSGVKMKRR